MKLQKIANISDDNTTHADAMKIDAWPISRPASYARHARRISRQAIDASYPLEKRAA
jgi:hypothetical protein